MNRRNTKQRNLILEAVKSHHDHPTAEQIAKDVQALDEKISVGTVYRNLKILSDEGLITDVNMSDADRYDLRTDPHCHLICEKCGKVFDVDIDYNEALDKANTPKGFIIHSHQTLFKGLCPECAKKNK